MVGELFLWSFLAICLNIMRRSRGILLLFCPGLDLYLRQFAATMSRILLLSESHMSSLFFPLRRFCQFMRFRDWFRVFQGA